MYSEICGRSHTKSFIFFSVKFNAFEYEIFLFMLQIWEHVDHNKLGWHN